MRGTAILLTQHHTASHASAQRGARVRHHTRCIGPMHGPGAWSTIPCAPIDAGRGLVVGHAGRGAAPRGVCGRRRAERRPRSRSQFESRTPGSTLTPLPLHHPCPPLLHSRVATRIRQTNRPPTHGGAETSTPTWRSQRRGAAWRDVRTAHVEEHADLVLVKGCARCHHLEVGTCTPAGAFCERVWEQTSV